MWRAAMRFRALNKRQAILRRSPGQETIINRTKGTLVMEGAGSPIPMTDVRHKLREVLGISTQWSDHVKALEERKLLNSLLPKSQKDLLPRRMKDSYIEVILPLGTQPTLREKYLTVYNSVRFGRILEDLDSIGDLCKKVISPENDIKFSGHVSWVGKTSMEVKMHMCQLHDTVYHPVLDATFVMVARDPENKGPAFINPLVPEGPEEEELFKQGEHNKVRRIASGTASLLKMAPTAEERNAVHNMFLNTLDPRTINFQSRILPPDSVWMEDTKLKSLQMCHPEERNIFNRIFGGFLMRKAFELGWATACNFAGSRPFLIAVDDIMFQRPVEIGSLLFFSSQVCFTEKNHIQVRVHSEVSFPGTKEHKTTNVFHFTFFVEKEVPSVIPKTYGDSMLYLDGHRHFMDVRHQKTNGTAIIH
ncbi:acyl-coenzyme A thioesterase 9, mitochondrial-like isoform X2 [Petaurus breviceps papuanus]|uniref:acyl-coenzyme A thioesterase 9, mitochondrial-like isoform X2 n=1 Tax=Petaurus breviceps papuanus TaxID=3040969 RepID=UPI0036D9755F